MLAAGTPVYIPVANHCAIIALHEQGGLDFTKKHILTSENS